MSSTAISLPDPTADLHWSDYRGAIHDIFAENAQRHPDRLCVVETQSSKTPRREFTYQQINHASNQVAHHLLENRVERGDVVMIYAHRGVDLVVAVFGVLKAGATFSVIDPAYPPDRQIIYLDVAKPKALIIIEKASQEAGQLSSQVRSYISENLDLKAEIPGLTLQDDGSLSGGQAEGKDVLAPQVHLAKKTPSLVVGPDDTPTLSFTSGSEGRPKGVQGRHFSLTYYFPWMATTFNLSNNDKFTMLSGIAHDPIQRDMFTPLFLGAQLLVPSREDIQHELLAKWMEREGATVTHLTPVQELAPNVNIVKYKSSPFSFVTLGLIFLSMFGTTETQRAVSYFEIPSWNQDPFFLNNMTEVIPAGRGMHNVQLLVVNREDREKQCDIGEIGEIYVRAGGLAEGYLGEELTELTRTKFVENWFVEPRKWIEEDNRRLAQQKVRQPWRQYYKGPRDRLYRSGDLGRYMPSGDVECTGRADNQVKIRGFRIELGEIDKWVSEHPLCQENVTLLRRDKDEEPTLVTYLVPDMKRWKEWLRNQDIEDDAEDDDSTMGLLKRFRGLCNDLREHLKTKLPSYAVPSVFLPLRRMPLNPNGKIDKPALPFPTADELSAAAVKQPRDSEDHNFSATEKSVASIWGKIIPHVNVESMRPDDSFFDLGGHSILAQYMLAAVKKHWQGIDLDIVTIVRNPTLRAFAAEIDRSLDPVGLRLDSGGQVNGFSNEQHYSFDASTLEKNLLNTYPTGTALNSQVATVFLTGATGFLGAYVLKDLLSRPQINIVAHVRANDEAAGLERIQETCEAYGIWSQDWAPRLSCVVGDLQKPKLGLNPETWQRIANNVDVVIHNGAKVHWVLPYDALKSANVLSTLSAMTLCATGKPKTFTFISSTSVLDTDHYVQLSESGNPVLESDDLEGSRKGLGTGYGQSKWVSEYLVRQAGKRGLKGTIVRPGYITGDSVSGVTNTDDFLTRYLKGCIQLHAHPRIENGINMVPVNHVARCVVACSLYPSPSPSSPSSPSPSTTTTTTIKVAHITAPTPRLTFTTFASTLQTYGYDVPATPYPAWRDQLIEYVEASSTNPTNPQSTHPPPSAGIDKASKDYPHALLPLYHFVTGDLISGTRAPELDDMNTVAALVAEREERVRRVKEERGKDKNDEERGKNKNEEEEEEEEHVHVNQVVLGRYIAYLVAVGFLDAPPPPPTTTPPPPSRPLPPGKQGKESQIKLLPHVEVSAGMKSGARGRN
ncbi:MAG: hypothetical protein Q9216_006216 [Gyalolechia sp. 2 TL-2023]